jgi:hypothetical protein
LNIEEAYD